MPYICLDCGELFDEPKKYKENIGEFWGTPCHETFYCCPYCGGDYEEATECKNCEEYFSQDELNEGYCDNCIDDYSTDFDFCYTMAKINNNYDEVKINRAIFAILGDDINEILADYIKKHCSKEEIKEYCECDRLWFADHLEKTLEYISEKENKK